jgi:hypothetical protein
MLATCCLAPATVASAPRWRAPRPLHRPGSDARAGGAGGAPHAAGQAARVAALEAALAAAQAAGAAAEAEAERARGAAAAGAAGAAAAEGRAGEARAEAAAAAREAADLARQVALLEVRRLAAVRARVAVVPTCGAPDLAGGGAVCPLHGWAAGAAGGQVTRRARWCPTMWPLVACLALCSAVRSGALLARAALLARGAGVGGGGDR